MGNSKWRLETSINLSIIHAKEAGFLDNLEIIVTDWGSEIPLSSVLNLVAFAEKTVKFIHVSNSLAKSLQKDSKFPEVIALNAAARNASGQYIGRIDNDTIVGTEFFEKFNRIASGKQSVWFKPSNAFMFIERRSIPYRYSSKSYPISYTYNYIKTYGSKLEIESARDWGYPFWWSPVGVMVFHKDIWKESRGYDEKLIYWGWMESDLALRLGKKYLLIDFKDVAGNFLYHLEHYPSLTFYKDRNGPATPRQKNKVKISGLNFTVNNENWGLYSHNLKLNSYKAKDILDVMNNINPLYMHKFMLMKYRFIYCKIIRNIDLLRMRLPTMFSNFKSFIKIKLGKIKKISPL
jgi:hypothetical protein